MWDLIGYTRRKLNFVHAFLFYRCRGEPVTAFKGRSLGSASAGGHGSTLLTVPSEVEGKTGPTEGYQGRSS